MCSAQVGSLISLAIAMACTGPVCAQAPAPIQDLAITITTADSTLQLWEGVVLSVDIQNLSGSDRVVVHPLLSQSLPLQQLSITTPTGIQQEVHSVVLLEELPESTATKAPNNTVKPGETKQSTVVVAFDWDHGRPLFELVGAYSLRLMIDGAVSNAITVTCAAVGEGQAATFARIEQIRLQGKLEALYAGHLLTTQKFRSAEVDIESIAWSPQSAWWKDYACLSLATLWRSKAEASVLVDEALIRVASSREWLERVSPLSPLEPVVSASKQELKVFESNLITAGD